MSNSKTEFGTILVAIDGSKHSEKVVGVACDLVKRLSAKISLVFVSSYKELEKEYGHYMKSGVTVREDTSPEIIEDPLEIQIDPAKVVPVTTLDTSHYIESNQRAIGVDEYYKMVGNAVLSSLERKINTQGLTCEALFEIGNPAAKLADLAKEKEVKMIFVGLQGLNGLDHLRTLGSVSRS